MKEAQKKKGPKKKDAEKEISLVATSDKGYAPLDLRKLLKKFDKTFLAGVLCEHSVSNYDLGITPNISKTFCASFGGRLQMA